MAGHRQRKLKLTGVLPPRRSAARGRRSAERLEAAAAPEDRLAVAFDVFRLALRQLGRRDPAQAASVAAGAADYLLGMATKMEAARP